ICQQTKHCARRHTHFDGHPTAAKGGTPERPWPHLDALARETAKAGKVLVERLAVYPAYARGGTLMNESITRAAGAVHGEEMPPEAMEDIIASLGRRPRQRTTLYGAASADRIAASFNAVPLRPYSVVRTHRLAHGA